MGRGSPPWAPLQAAEEFVEFVGGVKVGFEFAGGELFAEVVEAAGEEIEGGGEDFLIGENDVPPGGIGAAGEAEGIAKARTGEGDGKAVFVEMVVEEASEGDGGELRKMRGQANGVVMLLRAEPERTRADFFENFHEGGDARIVFSRGRADESVGVATKKIGVGMGVAGEFPAGHGMAAEEERSIGCGIKFRGGFDDADFGAAGIGDERVSWSVARDFRKKIERRANGKCDVDQVGILQGRSEFRGECFVKCAASVRFTNNFGAVPARDVHVGGVFAERESEGAADEAGAEDGGARDEVAGRHAQAMRRPMAGAMMRSSAMS